MTQKILCNLCGKTQNISEIPHFQPTERETISEIDNLITICSDCHAKLGHYNPGEYDFNFYLAKLMRESGEFADVTLESKFSTELPYIADITAKDKDSITFLIEGKNISSLSSSWLNGAISQIKKYKEVSSFDYYILAFPGKASAAQKDFLLHEKIQVWDLNYVAKKFKKEINESKDIYFKALYLTGSAPSSPSIYDQFLQELKNCPKGKSHWMVYQRLIGRIFENLFCPPLGTPISESSDEKAINRRDWIMANYTDKGFWNFLRERYNADYIVIDPKNYTKEIGKREVLQIANYLKPHGTGMFAIIVTRTGINSAGLAIIREQWIAYSKLIIVLTDTDIESMLLAKSINSNPSKIIGQAIENFRLSM